MRKRLTVRALLCVSLVAVALAASVVVVSARTRYRADSFLREIVRLQLRSSSFAQVRDVMTKYGAKSLSSGCDSGACSYTVEFKNTWLHRLHLAPLTRLSCTLNVKNDGLVLKGCQYFTDDMAGVGASVWETMQPHPTVKESCYVQREFIPRSAGPDIRYRVFVFLTPDASADEHRAAFGMNPRCLAKIGGCEDPLALLPTVPWGEQAMTHHC